MAYPFSNTIVDAKRRTLEVWGSDLFVIIIYIVTYRSIWAYIIIHDLERNVISCWSNSEIEILIVVIRKK